MLRWRAFLLLLCMPSVAWAGNKREPALSQDALDIIELRCPGWLEEYKVYHRAHKHSNDVTYLYYHCDHGCKGAGDRLRAAMFLLRVAALYKKILLIKWDRPTDLADYLAPNDIDWRTDGMEELLEAHPSSSFDTGVEMRKQPLYRTLMTGEKQAQFNATKIIRTKTNLDFWVRLHRSDRLWFKTTEQRTHYGHCLFSFLFKPSKQLVKQTRSALQQLYGSPSVPYAAWHWRSGGLVGEPHLARIHIGPASNITRLGQLITCLTCSRRQAGRANLSVSAAVPLLLITDMNPVRRFVSAGALRNVTTLPITAVHSDYSGSTDDDYMNIFVDIMLLASARCFMMSHSGISWAAAYMGGVKSHEAPCIHFMNDCIKDRAHKMFGESHV